MINSSNETQVVPKGNLYLRFREEERLKVNSKSERFCPIIWSF